MKAVILAGGLGTRLSEETSLKPKPMVDIGGKPILWHIMKIYAAYGVNEFIICLGYKGYIIKEFFANYFLHLSDVTFDLAKNEMQVHNSQSEPWKVTLVETGEDSMTGGRLKAVEKYLGDDQTFCFTYGDGLSSINIAKLIEFHKSSGRKATVTAVQPAGRFGALTLNDKLVTGFVEKPQGDGGWINGGYFVLDRSVLSLIENSSTVWEKEPMESLAKTSQLQAFHLDGFWHAMDTLRDKNYLEALWLKGNAPWKVW